MPGQLALPGMPVPPPPPEDMWIEAEIRLYATVRVNASKLVYSNLRNPQRGFCGGSDTPLDYADLTPELLSSLSYYPEERGSVFLWNQIYEAVDFSIYGEHIEERLVDISEIEFRWTPEQQKALDNLVERRVEGDN